MQSSRFARISWQVGFIFSLLVNHLRINTYMNGSPHFQYRDKEKLFPHADFQVVNRAAKEIFEEKFMLVEDLWFWGYFNSRVEKNRYRSIAFKKAVQ